MQSDVMVGSSKEDDPKMWSIAVTIRGGIIDHSLLMHLSATIRKLSIAVDI